MLQKHVYPYRRHCPNRWHKFNIGSVIINKPPSRSIGRFEKSSSQEVRLVHLDFLYCHSELVHWHLCVLVEVNIECTYSSIYSQMTETKSRLVFITYLGPAFGRPTPLVLTNTTRLSLFTFYLPSTSPLQPCFYPSKDTLRKTVVCPTRTTLP